MKKLSLLLAILLIMSAVLCGCGEKGADKALLGSWTGSTEGVLLTMTFEEEGQGSFSVMGGLLSYDFTYSTENGKLSLEPAEGASDDVSFSDANYTVEDDTLTIYNGDETLVLKKDTTTK